MGSPDNSGFEHVETLFHAALGLADEAERRAFLASACGEDAVLWQRVDGLLNAHREAGERRNFLPDQRTLPHFEKAGDRIGAYTLIEEIGAGAFGVVWKARQGQPFRREVALKILKAGMDTAQVMARFEAERQALALMDHPNIAKVFDAGATGTGRPYFVMELLGGTRITDYCDEHRLPTRERLLLFAQVCRALQHAHAKGIIHRDLKPSNILVCAYDGVPVPKVIDFGIGKAVDHRLTPETIVTLTGQFLGTPAYMSPEQTGGRGEGLDARSDIYSLGLLLYELLTGQLPLSAAEIQSLALDEVLRAIREKETPPPSTRLAALPEKDRTTVAERRQTQPAALRKLLRTDLDWVVLKCLEKDRARRYQTAGDVAADVQCHLELKPLLQARPPGASYRLRKTFQRHKAAWSVGGTCLALFALLITWGHFRQPVQGLPPQPEWREFPIRVKGYDKPWERAWSGMIMEGSNAWLCGSQDGHGGGNYDHMGHGVLLFSADAGNSWEELNNTNIESGTGTNRYFSNEIWTDEGPITSVHTEIRLQPDGKTRLTNGWITANTGIYATTNARGLTAKWPRITPAPDGDDRYAHFEGITGVEGFHEVYAFGWQGIAHLTGDNRWRIEKATRGCSINLVFGFRDQYWAAGGGLRHEDEGHGERSHPALYRKEGDSWWEVPLAGLRFSPKTSALRAADRCRPGI